MRNYGYLGVTIHFVNDDWDLKTYTLGILEISESHTAETTSDAIYNLLKEFEIKYEKDSMIICCVTDKGANMVKTA